MQTGAQVTFSWLGESKLHHRRARAYGDRDDLLRQSFAIARLTVEVLILDRAQPIWSG